MGTIVPTIVLHCRDLVKRTNAKLKAEKARKELIRKERMKIEELKREMSNEVRIGPKVNHSI